jgi:enoyl-CoA hydratase/carnithine racemase
MAFEYEPFTGEQVYKTYNKVIASRKDNIGIVTLNNPVECNVIGLPMYEEVADALREVEADDKVSVIVINASGKDFSVGIDYREIPTDYEGIVRYLEKQMPCLAVPGTLTKPLIGAVQGRAYAGGRPLVIPPADIVVVADNVRIGFNAINFGST